MATPFVGDDVVVLSSGYPDKVSVAVKPRGNGDVTATALWRYEKGSAYVPSPIIYEGLVYLLTDKGLVTCLDAKTGAVKYEGGRPPVAVERTNPLGEPLSASAAVAGGRLYIRGDKHLFAIGIPAGS